MVGRADPGARDRVGRRRTKPALAVPVPAAPASAITGRVVEAATGVAVEGALIRVLSPEASALTDADGRFSLAGQWPARVTLQVVMLGYALIERDVDTSAAGAPGSSSR